MPSLLPFLSTQALDGAGGPADDALQEPVWVPAPALPGLLGHTSFQLCILSFGEKSHCFPICRLGVRVYYPHYLSTPDLFSLPVVLCFLGAMTLVYSKERARSEPSAIYLEKEFYLVKRLLRENRF